MKTNLILLASLLLATTSLHAAQDDLSWMRGANYVPSYARNDVQTWMEYDPAVIHRELGYAARLRLNTVRVFLNVAVFEHQPEKFLADFENFLTLCDKHQIKMMPVLFDNCSPSEVVDVKNYKGKAWLPSPGFARMGDKDWPVMEKFIAAVVGKHRDDKRIVLWDVMNEPENGKWGTPDGKTKIIAFARRALQRAKAENPVAPIGLGWRYSDQIHIAADLSDVLIIHNYVEKPMQADIRQIKEMGKAMNKPVIINEFVGRPWQPIEMALPVVAKEKIGWCFWELMIGKTIFSGGKLPYQGHIYPDGTCFSATEVAAILNPDGFTGDATEIARKAGFELSEKAPKPFTDESIAFSPRWVKWNGNGPAGNRLWHSHTAGETATKEVTGTSVAVVFKHGPESGIAGVTIDGKPAATPEIDTCSKEVDGNRKTIVAENLSPGKHTVVVTVTGRESKGNRPSFAGSKTCRIQLVDIIGSLPAVAGSAQPIQPPGPEQSRSVGQIVVSERPALPAVIGGDAEGWVGGEIPPFTPPAKPVVDVPMRDPSICRGPDNQYYLIGTTEDSTGGFKSNWWSHNKGIEMWKSPDLKTWKYVGYVWTFEKDAKSDWQKGKLNADGTRTPKPLWAPELHYIKGQWYIACCVERLGCAILKSTTGRPEGPYADLKTDGSIAPGPLYDTSLFEDDDGQVYFLCSPGVRIARMKPDLSDLAEPLKHVSVAPGTKWHNCEGPHMAKLNGRYYLFAAQGTYHADTGGRVRAGEKKTYDIWALSAPTPYGPFEKRHLAFPRAGHNVVFQDHTGRWWSTWGTGICALDPGMSMILNSVPFYEKPGIIPIEMDSEGKLRQAQSSD